MVDEIALFSERTHHLSRIRVLGSPGSHMYRIEYSMV